jgi:AcrR family transcriptional regulator
MGELNPKFCAIVEKGKERFWKYGIRRVSVEEICRESGVSKMTFYKHFRNKNSLVMHIMDSLMEQQVKYYRGFWESDISMEEKVEKTIQMKMDNVRNLSMEFVKDIYLSDEQELKDYFKHRTEEALDMIRYDYREAQEKGLIRNDFSIDFIMYTMNHISEMIQDQRLISLYTNSSDLLHDLLEFFYYGIMPKTAPK